MALTRSEKEGILKELEAQVKVQKSVVLLTTKGAGESVDSTKNFEFRKNVKDEGATVRIVKNTLIERLFDSVSGLTGQTYLTYLDDLEKSDEVAVPKIVVDLVKKNDYKDNFNIVGSVINGEFMSPEDTVKLSKVPSFNDSMAMVAGSLQQVTAKIATSLNQVPSGVARGVDAYSKKLG